jgi:hypothetical protein
MRKNEADTSRARVMQPSKFLFARSVRDHRNISCRHAELRSRIQHAAIVIAIDARLNQHGALDTESMKQVATVRRESVGWSVLAIFDVRILGARTQNMEMSISGQRWRSQARNTRFGVSPLAKFNHKIDRNNLNIHEDTKVATNYCVEANR